MAVELAGIQLNRVHKMATLEQAALIHHRIPGLEGNLVQSLGRDSVQLQIEGIFYGPTASEDLEGLRDVYKQREPVDFLAEIVGQAYFGQVMVKRFEVQQLAQDPDQFSYTLIVAEYVPPPEPVIAIPATLAVDTSILEDAQAFASSVTNALDVLEALKIPDFIDPTPPLQGVLAGAETALSGLDGVTTAVNELFGGA